MDLNIEVQMKHKGNLNKEYLVYKGPNVKRKAEQWLYFKI